MNLLLVILLSSSLQSYNPMGFDQDKTTHHWRIFSSNRSQEGRAGQLIKPGATTRHFQSKPIRPTTIHTIRATEGLSLATSMCTLFPTLTKCSSARGS